jgi:hypothetical protein
MLILACARLRGGGGELGVFPSFPFVFILEGVRLGGGMVFSFGMKPRSLSLVRGNVSAVALHIGRLPQWELLLNFPGRLWLW